VPLPDETIPDGFYLIGTPCDAGSVQRRLVSRPNAQPLVFSTATTSIPVASNIKPLPYISPRSWLAAIIEGVRKVTHIAPPDANGHVVQEPVVQVRDAKKGGSCEERDAKSGILKGWY
jgi:hypothetical protein